MVCSVGWSVDDPLRLYFSSVEGNDAPSHRHSSRRSSNAGRNKPNLGDSSLSTQGATLWFSIYPAVPLELAHLLIHDMPVPSLAPHLRMFEQRQAAQQQEEHQQLIRQIQRHHEQLTQERAIRQQGRQQEADKNATSVEGSVERRGKNKGQSKTSAGRLAKGGGSGINEGKGLMKPGQLPLHRIPVRPLWWATGDWLHREVRLSQLLGPFFYRQLLRMRDRHERAESSDTDEVEVLDPRGEKFEDISSA